MIRVLVVLMVVAALAAPAAADEATVHPGEHVIIVDANGKPRKRIDATAAALYVIERETAVNCNVAHALNRKLDAHLTLSEQTAARLAKPEPGWQIAARWTAWTLSVVAAFAAGAKLF